MIDVLLLCECIMKVSQLLYNFAKLDVMQYISLPAFGWSAMLRTTGATIMPIQDLDTLLDVEKNIRGKKCFLVCVCARVFYCHIPIL